MYTLGRPYNAVKDEDNDDEDDDDGFEEFEFCMPCASEQKKLNDSSGSLYVGNSTNNQMFLYNSPVFENETI